MLRAALACFVLAVVAGLVGFASLWPAAVEIGRLLSFGFIVLALVSLILGTVRR